jgi:hypothetical protein
LERSPNTLHVHPAGKCGMRPNKECLAGLTRRKRWLCLYQGFSKYLSRLQHFKKWNIDHTTESTAEIDLTNKSNLTPIDRLGQLPTQGSSNHVRVHAAHDREHSYQDNFTFCKGYTHSPRVVTILDSRILIVHTSTLTHFRGVRQDITTRLFNGFL